MACRQCAAWPQSLQAIWLDNARQMDVSHCLQAGSALATEVVSLLASSMDSDPVNAGSAGGEDLGARASEDSAQLRAATW